MRCAIVERSIARQPAVTGRKQPKKRPLVQQLQPTATAINRDRGKPVNISWLFRSRHLSGGAGRNGWAERVSRSAVRASIPGSFTPDQYRPSMFYPLSVDFSRRRGLARNPCPWCRTKILIPRSRAAPAVVMPRREDREPFEARLCWADEKSWPKHLMPLDPAATMSGRVAKIGTSAPNRRIHASNA